MIKTYEVKYEIGTSIFVKIFKKIIEGKINQFRIVETPEKTTIHYLVIIPQELIDDGVYKNFDWFDEKDIFLNKSEMESK